VTDLSAAAEALGLPEALVRRSAAARAAETGADVEQILAAWAGGEAAAPSPPPTEPEVESAEAAPEAEKPAAEEVEEQPVAEAPKPPPVEMPAPAAARVAPSAPPPPPAEVTPEEAARVPVVVTVPTSDIKERTSFSFPRWLTGALVVAPLFALFALGSSATGACGEATELRTDVITGEIVNCDGSEFTGQDIGGGGDLIAQGATIYAGGEVTGVNCAGCHAASGQGLGTFPPLTGVLTTFGSCADHVEWVSLGTTGFRNEGRSAYGDTAKALGGEGDMPSFAASLSPEQIAAVAAFERVRFGGADPEAALVDCGLVEETPEETGAPGEEPPGEEGEEGDAGAGEETGTEDGDDSTTTTAP